MRKLGIGEVCKLLDIRAHVLRYWEQAVPFFDPEKNTGGRRVYSENEINLLFRLKFLIQERRFTLEGAVRALIEESRSQPANAKAGIHSVRKHILDVHTSIADIKLRINALSLDAAFPKGQEHLREILKKLPKGKRRILSDDLRGLSFRLLELSKEFSASGSVQPPLSVPVLRRYGSPVNEANICDDCASAFAAGTMALVTLLPAGFPPDNILGMLGRLAARFRETSYIHGKSFYWYLFCGTHEVPVLKERLRLKGFFGMNADRFIFVRQPVLPLLDTDGRLLVSPAGHLYSYSSGSAGALMMIESKSFRKHLEDRNIKNLIFLPVNRFSLQFPDYELLNMHFTYSPQLSLSCFFQNGSCRTTGIYVAQTSLFSDSSKLIGFSPERQIVKAVNHDSASADDIYEAQAVRLVSGPYRLIEKAAKKRALAGPLN